MHTRRFAHLISRLGLSAAFALFAAAALAQTATTTSLTSSVNPLPVTVNTVLTATVSPAAATGTVTFMDGATTLGTGTLSSGRAAYVGSFTATGTHSLTAVYAGGGSYLSSTSSPVSQSILPAPAALPSPPAAAAPIVTYEYDAQANLTKSTEAPSAGGFAFVTQQAYDPLGRVATLTDARSGSIAMAYDGLDRPLSVTDPRSLVTQIPRNGLGDPTQLVSPDSGTSSRTYDAAGNLLTATDSRSVLATMGYDALDRPTGVVYTLTGQPSQTFALTYDQTGAGFAYGVRRLTSTTHPSGSTQYKYDAQGRVLVDTQRVTAASGANSATITNAVTYTYNTSGDVTSVTYPSGRVLTIGYTAGKPSSLSLAKDGVSSPVTLVDQIQFASFGPLASWRWQLATGPQARTIVYDSSGRPVRYTLGRFVRDLSYDAADRTTAYTHYEVATGTATTAATALNQSIAYDELSRVTSVVLSSGTVGYAYDANGNRTSVVKGATTSTYTTSGTSNRLDSLTNPSRTLGYDAAGNTTSDGAGVASTYDLSGRLATSTLGGVTTTYSYDGQGRRVRKFSSTGAATTVIFAYDQVGRLLGEYDSTGVAIREYVWLGATPMAMFTPATGGSDPLVYFIDTDQLGTPRAVVDANNAVRWTWLAEPFGDAAPDANPQGLGAFTLNLRMPGQYFDAESGLADNWNRSYASGLGRYTQSDPMGMAGGINTYAYAGSNPASNVDPQGLFFTSVDAACAQNPQLCAELFGTIAENGANLIGDQCLAQDVQQAQQILGLAMAVLPTAGGLRNLAAQTAGKARLKSQALLPRGGSGAAKGVAEAKTVLGHFPEYKRLGDSLNARTFNIPEAAWNKMSEAQRWGANQKFLDRMISRGDEIILATPLDKVRPGSYFARELEYMGSKGYVPSADGTRLIRP